MFVGYSCVKFNLGVMGRKRTGIYADATQKSNSQTMVLHHMEPFLEKCETEH